jgi:hypothetical protein
MLGPSPRSRFATPQMRSCTSAISRRCATFGAAVHHARESPHRRVGLLQRRRRPRADRRAERIPQTRRGSRSAPRTSASRRRRTVRPISPANDQRHGDGDRRRDRARLLLDGRAIQQLSFARDKIRALRVRNLELRCERRERGRRRRRVETLGIVARQHVDIGVDAERRNEHDAIGCPGLARASCALAPSSRPAARGRRRPSCRPESARARDFPRRRLARRPRYRRPRRARPATVGSMPSRCCRQVLARPADTSRAPHRA